LARPSPQPKTVASSGDCVAHEPSLGYRFFEIQKVDLNHDD
jgi:hypothetical protein